MSGGCCSPLGPGTGPVAAFYQTVEDADGGTFQDPVLQFGSDFAVLPGPPTRVNLLRAPLPSVGVGDAQEKLTVNALGAWDTGANGFLQFATTALRNTYPGLRSPGMLAYVTTTQCLYMLAADLTTWNFWSPSPALNAQTAWFVNVSTGSDNNDGATSGTALASVEELSRRLCPGGQKMTFAVGNVAPTVTIAAGSYGELALNIGWPPGTSSFGSVLTIVGNTTQSAAITLATVVAEAPGTNTSAEITTLAGTFVDRGLLVQLTGAQTGAYAYSAGLNGPVTDTFTSAWLNFNTSSQAGPAVGNNVATVVLNTTIDAFVLTSSGKGYTVLQTAKVTTGFFTAAGVTEAFNDAAPYLLACELSNNGYFLSIGGVTFWSCRVPNGGGGCTFSGDHLSFAGCDFQTQIFIENGSNFAINFATLLDGGRFQMGVDTPGGVVSVRINGGAVQHVRGTGLNAWNLFPGCSLFSGSTALWGTRSPYAIGFVLQSGSWVYQSGSLANIKLSTTTTLYQVTGHNIGSGGVPLGYPRANCGVSLSPDPTAVAVTL